MGENQRFFLAVILSFIFVFLYTSWLAKEHRSHNVVASSSSESEPVQARVQGETQLVETPRLGLVDISSDLLKLTVSPTGGFVKSVELLKFKKAVEGPENVKLFNSEYYPGFLSLVFKDTVDFSVSYSLNLRETSNFKELELSGEISGAPVLKKLRFSRNSYLLDVEVVSSQPFSVAVPVLLINGTSRLNLRSLFKIDSLGKVSRLRFETFQENLHFSDFKMIGFDDLYFANVSVFEGAKNKAIYDRNLQALLIPASGRLSFKVFWGPKELHLLESYGQDFKKLIDLGFFAILAEPILRFLLWLGDLLKNYGLAIVLMTIIIRLLLYPLNSISYKAMQKLKEIQPELEELKAKYKDDPQALNRELILFYQKKGVNPLKGCLPILLQLPIFFGLFSALHHAIELRYSTFFGWIKDLSSPDYIYIFSFPVPLLTLILGATLIWQHKITPIQVSDPDQERVLKLMPYIFIVMLIIVPLPAGNLVYWLVSNILSIGQQLVMQRSGLKINPFWINLALGCAIFLISGLLVWLF